TSWPRSFRWTCPGTNWVKELTTAMMGFWKSSSFMPVARQRARAPAMLRPAVVVRERYWGMGTSTGQGRESRQGYQKARCGPKAPRAACLHRRQRLGIMLAQLLLQKLIALELLVIGGQVAYGAHTAAAEPFVSRVVAAHLRGRQHRLYQVEVQAYVF